jgi:hypothetical protein
VIYWNDFIFDEVVGFVLAMPEEHKDEEVRGTRLGGSSIRNDAELTNAVEQFTAIQETRREQRPARMVGLSGLDSNAASSDRKSASASEPMVPRQRGEG